MVQVLSSYHGVVSLNETCKAVVGALPPTIRCCPGLRSCFRIRASCPANSVWCRPIRQRRLEMAGWLADPDAKIRAFAESYVRLLDRQIAAEQRRSEESIEMRKRMYGDPDSGGKT